MSKLTRAKKREIREQVRHIAIRQLQQINLFGFAEGSGVPELEYARTYLNGIIEGLEAAQTGLVASQAEEQGDEL